MNDILNIKALRERRQHFPFLSAIQKMKLSRVDCKTVILPVVKVKWQLNAPLDLTSKNQHFAHTVYLCHYSLQECDVV